MRGRRTRFTTPSPNLLAPVWREPDLADGIQYCETIRVAHRIPVPRLPRSATPKTRSMSRVILSANGRGIAQAQSRQITCTRAGLQVRELVMRMPRRRPRPVALIYIYLMAYSPVSIACSLLPLHPSKSACMQGNGIMLYRESAPLDRLAVDRHLRGLGSDVLAPEPLEHLGLQDPPPMASHFFADDPETHLRALQCVD
jgi:hypothetical protein